MNKELLLTKFHQELRYDALSNGYSREQTPFVVRQISTVDNDGFIIASNLHEKNARKVIKSELNYFRNIKQDFEWKVYSYDQPDNLIELLSQEGFSIDETEVVMAIPLNIQHSLLQNPILLVKEILDENGIQDLVILEETIWKSPQIELGERLWRDKQQDPESLFIYGIYEQEKLVSTAWMYLEKNSSFASLWGGSTLPSYRGKGFYKQLLSVRAKKAFEKGYDFLTVDASPMSQPILEKLGFQSLALTNGCQSPTLK